MTQTNREHPRGVIQTAVRYFVWDRPHEATATEIGVGGIFIETPSPAAEGSLLTLRVALPQGRAFTVLGRVVRTVRGSWARLRRTGMGIKFIDLSAGDRGALLGYIAQHPLLSR